MVILRHSPKKHLDGPPSNDHGDGRGLVLWPYQQDGVARVRESYIRGRRAPLIVLPTGAGKTIVLAAITTAAHAKGRSTLIVVHRRELLMQASEKLRAAGVPHGVNAAGFRSAPEQLIQLANIQTIAGRLRTARLAVEAGALARVRSAIGGVRSVFDALRGHLGGAWSGLTSLKPPLAALGADTSLAGIFELVRHVAEARHEVTKMAETIGIAPPQMVRLNFAARMTGTNIQSMQVGLTKLNKVMGDTVRGKNKDAAALFRQIGISTQDLASGNAATILPKIAASFQATHSATMRAAMAQALFGRGWREVAPRLLACPEEMCAWIAQLDRLGYKFTQVDDNNLTAFRRSWVGLETAVGGFTNMLGRVWLPC